MKTIARVWLYLLVLFFYSAQVALAAEFTLKPDTGDGDPDHFLPQKREADVSLYLYNQGLFGTIQQGDTLKVFFPNNWMAIYLVSVKATINDTPRIFVLETSPPTKYSVAGVGAPGDGISRGCGGVTVTPVGTRQDYSATIGDTTATGSEWRLTGFNISGSENCR